MAGDFSRVYMVPDFSKGISPRTCSLEAAVHWADARERGEEIAAAIDRLIRAMLPYCRAPELHTLTSGAPFDEARWSGLRKRLAAGRLAEFTFREVQNTWIYWRGKKGAPGALLRVSWPGARILEHRGPSQALVETFDLAKVQDILLAAMSDLFTDLHPVYGFINLYEHSIGLRSLPEQTDREIEFHLVGFYDDAMLSRPEAVTRYIRGTFWANFLTAEHIEKLGGIEAVLTKAPCFKVERIGAEAVLLQATPSLVDLRPEHLAPLTAYLAPVLPSRVDLGYSPDIPKPKHTLAELWSMPEPEALPRQKVAPYGPSFPVVDHGTNGLNDWPDVVFALTLTAEPTDELMETLRRELTGWDDLGSGGAFGGTGFTWMSELIVEDDKVAWQVDLGDAQLDAYYDLLRRLDALQHDGRVPIVRLELGVRSA